MPDTLASSPTFGQRQAAEFANLFGHPPLAEIEQKRREAWTTVRWHARHALAERRMFHETANLIHHRRWEGFRGQLAHSLKTWAAYRDWAEALRQRAAMRRRRSRR